MEDNSLVHFSILDTPIDDSPFVADKEPVHRSYTNPFSVHPAYRHVFRPQRLTFGLMAPFTGYPNPEPESFTDLIADAQRAEAAGLTALWVRDVPMFDPYFGDVGQGLDPMVTLGMLAANTKNIALGSAGFISSLRYPIHVAKAAVSVDVASQGRMLLGLCTGDRPIEFTLFGQDFHNRGERFRDSWDMIRCLTNKDVSFPVTKSTYYGRLPGSVDVTPHPTQTIPMIAIGRCRQPIQWLANNVDAWIWHGVNPRDTRKIVDTLQRMNERETWVPFGYGNMVELLADEFAPVELIRNVYIRGGIRSLAAYYREQAEQGLSHVILNFKPTPLPMHYVLDAVAEYLLPITNDPIE